MAANPSTERLRFTPLSAVRAVALFGLTLVILRLFAAAGRVIGWVLVAASLAGLLHPAVAPWPVACPEAWPWSWWR